MNYAQPNPAEPKISNWLIQNPQRINLGRVGFWFGNESTDVTEEQLESKTQTLDLYSGTITSSFSVFGQEVTIETTVDPDSDTMALRIQSALLGKGKLGVFFDYPYPNISKFDYPFVGSRENVSLHTTTLRHSGRAAQIRHDIDATTYFTNIQWEGRAEISGPLAGSHRYILQPREYGDGKLNLTIAYTPRTESSREQSAGQVADAARKWWNAYWESGAFVSLPTDIADAKELQRRTILSQYLLAVNGAGKDPPQESGLVNNGWYGKFHMEMVFWHLVHWNLWGKSSFLERSIPGVYERFLPTSLERARNQGYTGAKWGKMSDPTGRSAPGEINSLLIWQQPHPMYFAELEWREKGEGALAKWDVILSETAEYMVSVAWWNVTTGKFSSPPLPSNFPLTKSPKASLILALLCIPSPKTPTQTQPSTPFSNSHTGASVSPSPRTGNSVNISPSPHPGPTSSKISRPSP